MNTQPLQTEIQLENNQLIIDNSEVVEGEQEGNGEGNEEGNRYSYLLRIKIGNLEFSNLRGDFLGDPVIKRRTRQFSEVDFCLNDQGGQRRNDELSEPEPEIPTETNPASSEAGQNTIPESAPPEPEPEPESESGNGLSESAPAPASVADSDSLWAQIKANEGSEVIVELGFPPNLHEILKGKAYRIGRKLPDGVILEIVDQSALLAQSTGSSVVATEERLPDATPGAEGAEVETQSEDSESIDSGVINPGVELQAQAGQAAANTLDSPQTTILAKSTEQTGLEFSKQSQHQSGNQGDLTLSQSSLQAASTEAASHGDVIVAEGDTIRQVGAGQGTPTGIVLDWNERRSCFIRPPTITKKTPLQLQGAGALSVSGWSVNDKNSVGTTVVTPSAIGIHPTGVISVPNWQDINLNDPIIAGSPYTWADATRNGERVPENQGVVQRIIRIAQVITELTQQTGGSKFTVTSWYRDPATNMRVSSSGAAGPHTTGNAVDFWFPGIVQLFEQLEPTWEGGLAAHPAIYNGAGFVHIDLGARRRWNY